MLCPPESGSGDSLRSGPQALSGGDSSRSSRLNSSPGIALGRRDLPRPRSHSHLRVACTQPPKPGPPHPDSLYPAGPPSTELPEGRARPHPASFLPLERKGATASSTKNNHPLVFPSVLPCLKHAISIFQKRFLWPIGNSSCQCLLEFEDVVPLSSGSHPFC